VDISSLDAAKQEIVFAIADLETVTKMREALSAATAGELAKYEFVPNHQHLFEGDYEEL
jgi:hypothetical protein